MDLKIDKLDISRMHREELRYFNEHMSDIVTPICDPECIPFKQYMQAASEYDSTLAAKGVRESISLTGCDKAVGDSWSGMNYQIKASLLHPDPQIREAAQTVFEVFRKTKNPLKMKYAKSYGALLTLISQLESLPRETLVICRVNDFFEALDRNVQAFLAAEHTANATRSTLKTGIVQENADACRKAWSNFASYLESMALAEQLPGVEDAIHQINIVIAQIKSDIEARKKKGKGDDDKDEASSAKSEAKSTRVDRKAAQEASAKAQAELKNAVDTAIKARAAVIAGNAGDASSADEEGGA